jgi:hypothetical protein
MSDYLKTYFQRLENGISQLPEKERAKVYRDCGQACVKNGVLQAQQKLFEKCSGNLDAMYARMSELGEISGKVICSGSEYEINFPRCLCPLYEQGFLLSACHCECSRQSILYVLKCLLPESPVDVKMKKSVLAGDTECVFTVIYDTVPPAGSSPPGTTAPRA